MSGRLLLWIAGIIVAIPVLLFVGYMAIILATAYVNS